MSCRRTGHSAMARCSTPPSSSGRFQQTLRKRGIQPANAVREFVKSDQFNVVYVVGFSVHLAMTAFGGGLNRSTQHFILEGKMECSDGSGISPRVHGGCAKRTSCGHAYSSSTSGSHEMTEGPGD